MMISLAFSEILEGSKRMPDFPPPKGTPIRAVFHVISIASPVMSSAVTSGVILMPPLAGPRASLWRTRNVSMVTTSPSANAGVMLIWIFSRGTDIFWRMAGSILSLFADDSKCSSDVFRILSVGGFILSARGH